MSSKKLSYFVIISSWKRAGPFKQTKGFLVPGLAEDGSVLEKRILNVIHGSLLFWYYLLLKKSGALHLNLNPLYLRMIYVKIKLCSVVYKDIFFYFVNLLLLFPFHIFTFSKTTGLISISISLAQSIPSVRKI